MKGIIVSIPFKRESPFGQNTMRVPFPSYMCFNSLQTGKSFRTILTADDYKGWEYLSVSIPFKRESPFGPELKLANQVIHQDGVSFNSLQTGKSFRTDHLHCRTSRSGSVSIPFKRESPFGLNRVSYQRTSTSSVSIPFKRESPFGRS